MGARNPGRERLVWVACVPQWWPTSVLVEDALGVVREVTTRGPYCIFEDTDGRARLGVAADWVREVTTGCHLVQFGDGSGTVVRLDSPYQWELRGVAA